MMESTLLKYTYDLQKAKESVAHWNKRLKGCGHLDKDGKEICLKNLEIAKNNVIYLESVKPVQMEIFSCARSCSPSDYVPGGKCDLNGCYTKN